MRPINRQQQRFVDEYLKDLNASQACIRAGYSARNAGKIGPKLLGDSRIKDAIELKMEKRSERCDISADKTLKEIARLAFSDVRKLFKETGSLKDIQDLDDDTAASVASIEVTEEKDNDGNFIGYTKKLKMWDKGRALDQLCRHLGITKEKIELTGRDGGPIETVGMSDEERLEKINLLILSVKARQAEIAQVPAITEAKEGDNANG